MRDKGIISQIKKELLDLYLKSNYSEWGGLHFLMIIVNLVVYFILNDSNLIVKVLCSILMVMSQLFVIHYVIEYLIKSTPVN